MSKQSHTYQAGTLTYTKAGLVMLFVWLLWGDFCFQLMETAVPSTMLLKFKALGAPNALIGTIMGAIPGVINMTLNPVISVRSDRCRSRWGRRIPFILFTLPFLVVCLFGLAFSDNVAAWLRVVFMTYLNKYSAATVSLTVLGGFLALFAFFNTFVNSIFWYLFNDVVPEHLLARFTSWFRLVGMGAGSLYSLFFLKHAGTHSAAILSSAALIYFFGFGLMCLRVKEGKYPPPPENIDGGKGVVSVIKTYGKECMGLVHYWYIFLVVMGMSVIYAGNMFTLYYNQATGLSLDSIGKLGFVGTLGSLIAVPLSGWLADKYHPIRVVVIGLVLQIIIVVPLSMIWLFWQPAGNVVFYVRLAGAAVIGTFGIGLPVGTLVQLVEGPLIMRIFPRERYGQFCSAASIFRSISGIVAGMIVGAFLDMLTARWGSRAAYCCLPLWFLPAYVMMLFFMIKLYGSWQRYGGDEAYIPPLPRHLRGEPADRLEVIQTPVESP